MAAYMIARCEKQILFKSLFKIISQPRFFCFLLSEHVASLNKKYQPVNLTLRRLKPVLSVKPWPNIGCSGYRFASLKSPFIFGDTAPVLWTQDCLIRIHDAIGCPWWLSIVLTVTTLRLLTTLPLSIYQNYILAKYQNLTPEIIELSKELKKETSLAVKIYKLDERTAKIIFKRSLKNHISKLIVRDNCHPFKSTLSVCFQLPVWICFSSALRNLTVIYPPHLIETQIAFSQLTVEGTLWFSDLTLHDPTYAIPIILGIVNLAVIEFNVLRGIGPESGLKKWVTNGLRCFTIVLVPIAVIMPSCVSFYWLISSLFGLFQNAFLMFPKMRRLVGIPKSVIRESDTPFQDIKRNFKEKFIKKKK